MKKTIYLLVMAVLYLNLRVTAQQFAELSGQITSASGKPLAGATIKIKSGTLIATTDNNGNFKINTSAKSGTLVISYLGYQTKEVTFDVNNTKPITVILQESESALDEVSVVSTGYQNIPKERATGSFVLIDSALLQRKVSMNILDRLDGITSGLIFNRGITDGSNKSDITIRGRSTIFANANPLIVLDNFPFEGDINTINPNDIETITVLKDAAASSIWGVRAGNGVIVISTKKGKKSTGTSLNFSSNLTIGEKPNLWYPYQMSSPEYLELEQFLFDNGYYNNTLNNAYSSISPGVALMNRLKNNEITIDDFQQKSNNLKKNDVRNGLKKYFYRESTNQQYNLNLSGGNKNQKYYLSGGYDRNLSSRVSDRHSRFTLNANNTYYLLKDKLELYNSLSFTKSTTGTSTDVYKPFSPYDAIADVNGNPLPIVSYNTLRSAYTDTAGKGKLLDWRYFPINEQTSNRNINLVNFRFLTGITYKIIDQLKFQVNYQYEKITRDNVAIYPLHSFYTRDYINRFSSINDATGIANSVIPSGDLAYTQNTSSDSQYARLQLSYNKQLGDRHDINAIAGFEIKDYSDQLVTQNYYGLDPVTKANGNSGINPMTQYPFYYNPFLTATIPTAPGQTGTTDRYRSYYVNASYAYLHKYIFSASARKDETNIFGVKSNQKGVPLWSAGIGWNLSEETFYRLEAFPYLKLRVTYGYNGNADKTTSAYLTSGLSGTNLWNTNYSRVINPPNPSLSWEKIENLNLGIDFASKKNWVTGSIEYYSKKGKDLIGNSPIAPQTGISVFRGNTADTRTHGLDVVANFNILSRSNLGWVINVLYSYSSDKITDYKLNKSVNGDILFGNYSNPLVGYPYYSVFAFKSPGLDIVGDPQGYLNGQISKDYSGIYNSKETNELIYMGAGTPTSFGSFRNTLSLKNWSLSINLIYKLNYYFRRSGVFSGSSYTYLQTGFNERWKKPGDELFTNIPSLVYPDNTFRGIFYEGSEQLVEKGDHIRLQDVRFSYKFKSSKIKSLGFKNMECFAYLNNLGILWRANKQGLDPDAGTTAFPATTTYSFGINATF